MNKDTFEGKWKEMKGEVKQQWGKLTDDDLAQINGSYEEMEGRIQKAYGYQKEEARKQINEFLKNNGWEDE